jgi:hypothetical protein
MILKNGDVKLMDFGISLDKGSDLNLPASFEQEMGTPRYMSPEQFSSNAVDLRSDIYSFGIVSYEMITGRPPFIAEDRQEYARLHQAGILIPVNKLAPRCPRKVRRFVHQCLEKSPTDRPRSLETLPFSTEVPNSSPRIEYLLDLLEDPRTGRLIKWGIPVLFALAALVIGTVLILGSRPPRKTPPSLPRRAPLSKPVSEKEPPPKILPSPGTEAPPRDAIRAPRPEAPPALSAPPDRDAVSSAPAPRPASSETPYRLLDFDEVRRLSEASPHSAAITALSSRGKNLTERKQTLETLLWTRDEELVDLVPLVRARDEILVKHLVYVFSIRNFKHALAEIRKRLRHEGNEELLVEMYRSLGYFDSAAVAPVLNEAFLETDSIPILRAIMEGLSGMASPRVQEKAETLLLLVEKEVIRFEIFAFLASHGDMAGRNPSRDAIHRNADPQVRIQALKTLAHSPDPHDLAFLKRHKRSMYKSVELLNTYLETMAILNTLSLEGTERYDQMEIECRKNKPVLAWLALFVARQKHPESNIWLRSFMKRHALRDYRDYIRAYYLRRELFG